MGRRLCSSNYPGRCETGSRLRSSHINPSAYSSFVARSIKRLPSCLTNDSSSSSNPLTRQTADTLILSRSMNSSRTDQTFNASLFSTSNLRCCKVCGFDFVGLRVRSENSQRQENPRPSDCRCIVEGSDRVGAVSAISTAGSAH
jgi:hypothetical protein